MQQYGLAVHYMEAHFSASQELNEGGRSGALTDAKKRKNVGVLRGLLPSS
jgi:hypothetical protein